MKTIGFIGLGIMGKPMAQNLIKAGYPLVVYDIVQERVDQVVATGATAATSCQEVARQSDVIIVMVPDSPQVEEVMLGPNSVLDGLTPGTVVIDMSSISPLVDMAIEKKVRAKQAHMLDAPVSGGEPGAIAGTLAIMVGGDETIFNDNKPLLDIMGRSVVLVGPIGAGQFTKLANQILVGIHLQAMSEALVFAQKAGLDVQKVYEAIRSGLAGSHVLDAKVPLVLKRNYNPGFRIKLHIKDLKNALITGRELGIPLPATALTQAFFEACAAAGRGDLDHGALITVTEELAKTQVGKT